MRYQRHVLGQDAEYAALWFLKRSGLKVVTTNYHCPLGEIDLVMIEHTQGHDCLVFVEVRARSERRTQVAVDSVHYKKRLRLIKTAQFFLLKNPNFKRFRCRFDVVALSPLDISGFSFGKKCLIWFNIKPYWRYHIQWIKQAFVA